MVMRRQIGNATQKNWFYLTSLLKLDETVYKMSFTVEKFCSYSTASVLQKVAATEFAIEVVTLLLGDWITHLS